MPCNQSAIPTAATVAAWPHLHRLQEKVHPLQPCEVGLLIGYDCRAALSPLDIIPAAGGGPYALLTRLGMSIVGPNQQEPELSDCIGSSHRIITALTPGANGTVVLSARTNVKEMITPRHSLKLIETDFKDVAYSDAPLSIQDQQLVKILDTQTTITHDNHYCMPLPFRSNLDLLKPNRYVALQWLNSLRGRFMKDAAYAASYTAFVKDMLDNGYAEPARQSHQGRPSDAPAREWYIPHHSVHHPVKKKLRVVFDGSSRQAGPSINECLLQGPDLTNNLIGVLLRFNLHCVAFMCDIKSMFYQFYVREDHRDFLKLLWWPDGDSRREPLNYRMTVHVFGASSSPGVANYGLKKTATDRLDQYDIYHGFHTLQLLRAVSRHRQRNSEDRYWSQTALCRSWSTSAQICQQQQETITISAAGRPRYGRASSQLDMRRLASD